MKLATFDIFDTCLIRKCGSPDVVPHLVALKLWPQNEMIRQEYVIARRQADQKAGVHANIKDIYSQDPLQCLPDYSSDQIIQAEMDMESEMLVPNSSSIKLGKLGKVLKVGEKNSLTLKTLITFLRKDGWTIKFLSDMYLPSNFLESILIREGFIKVLKVNKDEKVDNSDNSNNSDNFSEHVIVSCEWGARKDTGKLYKEVREKYHPTEWIHFGDNLHSDYKMARKNGVMAIRVNTAFSAIEKKVSSLAYNSRNQYQTKLLAGLMRYARLTSQSHYGEGLGVRLEDLEGAVSLAADYIAPLYIPYVAFVLKRAREMGIKRLYFLSRDGYIMQKIAEAIDPKDIELKYLLVSRKALIPAFLLSRFNLTGELRETFLQITDRQHLIGRTVDYLLSQLQLDRQELSDKFDIKFNFNKILNKKQQEEFLDKIFNNPKFTPHLLSVFKEKKRLTLAYLSQEGLRVSHIEGNLEAAMVDIGWLGTTRLMINSILAKSSSNFPNSPISNNFNNSNNFPNFKNIPTFYVGVRNDVYSARYGSFFSYFPYNSLSTEATGLIENYYSASPWPSTIGYRNGSLPTSETDYRSGSLPTSETDYRSWSLPTSEIDNATSPLSVLEGKGNIPVSSPIQPIFKEGEEYNMNPIIETNVKVACDIAKELKLFLNIIDEELLFQWAKITVESLSSMEFPVDLTPMSKSSEFDGVPMVKKLSIGTFVKLICLGDRVSAFDRGSLACTLGYKISQPLWTIHKISGKARSLAYKALIKIKNKS